MSSILLGSTLSEKIYNRFPLQYREDDSLQKLALKRYIETAGEGFESALEDVKGLLNLIDSNKVKKEHLPILFKHYGFEVFNGIPEQYLRYLLPKLGELYATKGSLNSVDYICSSLSGIKTDTNVEYDAKGNPNINVRLEMDYNIGSFIPDSVQLNRILTRFIPFYCDLTLIYSYLFYESSKLWYFNEKDTMKVTEILVDSNNVSLYEKESFKLNSVEEETKGIHDITKENVLGFYLNEPRSILNSASMISVVDCFDRITMIINGKTEIFDCYPTKHCYAGLLL